MDSPVPFLTFGGSSTVVEPAAGLSGTCASLQQPCLSTEAEFLAVSILEVVRLDDVAEEERNRAEAEQAKAITEEECEPSSIHG